jgi:tight adherence protein B
VALDGVRAGLRAEEEQRRRVAAELAAPKATARLLAGLPVLGVGMGYLMGADPVGLLVSTPVGAALLVTGLAFETAGLLWVGRIARAAERGMRWSASPR